MSHISVNIFFLDCVGLKIQKYNFPCGQIENFRKIGHIIMICMFKTKIHSENNLRHKTIILEVKKVLKQNQNSGILRYRIHTYLNLK